MEVCLVGLSSQFAVPDFPFLVADLTIKVLAIPENDLIYLDLFAHVMMNPAAQIARITGIDALVNTRLCFNTRMR